VLARDICSTMGWLTMLMTTSGTSRTFSWVCFKLLSLPLREGEKIMIGGSVEKMLKKLKGLRFTWPCRFTVEAKQIGLGATAVRITLCSSCWLTALGSMVLIICLFLVGLWVH